MVLLVKRQHGCSREFSIAPETAFFLPVAVSLRAEFNDENIQVQIEFCSHQKHL